MDFLKDIVKSLDNKYATVLSDGETIADCEEFVDWYIEKAKEEGCDVGIFLGDWHHNRNSLNITTMDYSLRALEKLGQAFDQFFFFPAH